jgi:small subunit ribosomal protein S3
VKVWIYKGDITNKELAREQATQKSSRPERRDGDRRRAPRAEQPATAGVEA